MAGLAHFPARVSEGARLLSLLAERGWTVAVAESLTGGLVVSSLIEVAGASATVRGGIVAYATPVKATLLGVDQRLLEQHGAVHPEVARQMADGVRTALAVGGVAADMGLATTGNAGPLSSDGQPVGTVHIAVSTPRGTRTRALLLDGSRADIRAETVRRIIGMALEEF